MKSTAMIYEHDIFFFLHLPLQAARSGRCTAKTLQKITLFTQLSLPVCVRANVNVRRFHRIVTSTQRCGHENGFVVTVVHAVAVRLLEQELLLQFGHVFLMVRVDQLAADDEYRLTSLLLVQVRRGVAFDRREIVVSAAGRVTAMVVMERGRVGWKRRRIAGVELLVAVEKRLFTVGGERRQLFVETVGGRRVLRGFVDRLMQRGVIVVVLRALPFEFGGDMTAELATADGQRDQQEEEEQHEEEEKEDDDDQRLIVLDDAGRRVGFLMVYREDRGGLAR